MLTWAGLFITLITWLLWHKWWLVITEHRCSHHPSPSALVIIIKDCLVRGERADPLGYQVPREKREERRHKHLQLGNTGFGWEPEPSSLLSTIIPPSVMNILSGLDQSNAQLTSYDNCLPLDRSPELLFNSHRSVLWDGKTPQVSTRVFSPFSGQFLTWSFFAPISCLALNGFHSCFLKPEPACYRAEYKVRSVRVWRHWRHWSGSFILQWINTGGKVKENSMNCTTGCWYINDNFTLLLPVLL